MMRRIFGAAILIAGLAIGAPVWAEGPMTPLRHSGSPPASPDTTQQWVEPPPAPTQKTPAHTTDENAAPNAQPEQSLPEMRTSRDERRRAGARGWSTRQLNRQQLYGGWSGASMPYYRGYGPAPYSASG